MSQNREQLITLADLALIDLTDRPFLHEQGNTVTRGFVTSLQTDNIGWTITLRNVEWLNKSVLEWQPDEVKAEYGGHRSHTCVEAFFERSNSNRDRGIEISWYGSYMYIGIKTESPWQDNDWPELDTDCLEPGPMER